MTLTLISLGLWSEKSMSLEALEEAQACDVLYVEFYTAKLVGATKEKLGKVIGKEVKLLGREQVESDFLINEAEGEKVGLLVGGDALTATTHIDLMLEAKKKGIETKYIPGASIYSVAPGLAGLQIYKFGRTASVPFPEENFRPETPYDVLKENKKMGLHTLVLLDTEPSSMTANEAMKILLEIGEKRGAQGRRGAARRTGSRKTAYEKKMKNVFTEETNVVVVARAGSENPLVKYGKVGELLEDDFGGPLHCFIVPGKLHFKEEEALGK